ncbi:hypothetical protein BMETH_693_0 [methanotrophic bacterial endosymbiont of Bathymodiolus sp.]|nr:hypothetical protein BMETH_693_0 [methanotrophic bacterial endosymbiont of Bathymodiolus sp.]
MNGSRSVRSQQARQSRSSINSTWPSPRRSNKRQKTGLASRR